MLSRRLFDSGLFSRSHRGRITEDGRGIVRGLDILVVVDFAKVSGLEGSVEAVQRSKRHDDGFGGDGVRGRLSVLLDACLMFD